MEEGLNTYAIGDLADIQIEPGVASNWLSNDYQFFRFDPHEYSEARTTQLHFLRLAPYDTATPSFNLTWVDSDGDDDATIALYYDTDKIPFNGNETLVVNGLSENATNSYTWNASGVASGVYQILAQISDGRNTTQRYATGPLQVQGANNDYLYNISSRSQVGTGGNIMIAGLIIEGSGPKTVLLRGRGPSINIPSGKLANPYLDLVNAGGNVVAANNDWGNAANSAAIQATGLAPTNAQEAAILITLNPGAYTTRLSGVNNTTGIGIVEAFDVDGGGTASLGNISTRSQVGTSSDILIAGFIINGTTPKTVLLRGRGPSINIPSGKLANPYMDLVNSSGTVIATNDNWGNAANSAAIQATGLAPTNAQEAAILITLNPGAYTTRLSGINNTTGIGIVEVFDRD